MRPHRRQPTRLPRPWDSPGKNTGVGCHCLLYNLARYYINIISSLLLIDIAKLFWKKILWLRGRMTTCFDFLWKNLVVLSEAQRSLSLVSNARISSKLTIQCTDSVFYNFRKISLNYILKYWFCFIFFKGLYLFIRFTLCESYNLKPVKVLSFPQLFWFSFSLFLHDFLDLPHFYHLCPCII